MSTVVKTESGAVEGERYERHVAFRGIPYASPPVGPLRFAAPSPPLPWTGVRAARAFGASAIQGVSFAPGSVAEGVTSEDCLYVNVYTPAADGRKRPVLFFIHGGAFIVGSSSAALYDGGPLAVFGDQVVVTFNYRLGAFGYLYLGELGQAWGAAPNAGALDQIAALRWVQTNIDRFGGDPNNVTIFGESAGGTSVVNLMATPSAVGLFQRVVAQSPANAGRLAEPAVGLRFAEELLSHAGFSFANAERLRDLSAAELRSAQLRVRGRPSDLFGFLPILDAGTVPVQPRDVLAAPGGAKIPLVIGANRDEWNLFELPTPEDLEPGFDVAAELARKGFPAPPEDVPRFLTEYRSSREREGLPHHDRALYRALIGDFRFRIPSIRFAEIHASQNAPTYAYSFNYGSPALRGALGACHALELPFVFGTLNAPLHDRFAGVGPEVSALSSEMMRAWTAFAKTGDPSGKDARDTWSTFDAERRSTQIFDVNTRIENAPFDSERRAWDGIPKTVV
jgi:para-nitrobenzyl esterase